MVFRFAQLGILDKKEPGKTLYFLFVFFFGGGWSRTGQKDQLIMQAVVILRSPKDQKFPCLGS